MFKMLAAWEETAFKARVVVATPPELMSSLATGEVTPMPTKSVVVERRTMSGATDVQPPAEVPPIAVTMPQETVPEPSVWSAEEALLQLSRARRKRDEPMPAIPEVSSVPADVFTLPTPNPPVT